MYLTCLLDKSFEPEPDMLYSGSSLWTSASFSMIIYTGGNFPGLNPGPIRPLADDVLTLPLHAWAWFENINSNPFYTCPCKLKKKHYGENSLMGPGLFPAQSLQSKYTAGPNFVTFIFLAISLLIVCKYLFLINCIQTVRARVERAGRRPALFAMFSCGNVAGIFSMKWCRSKCMVGREGRDMLNPFNIIFRRYVECKRALIRILSELTVCNWSSCRMVSKTRDRL